MPGDGNYVSCCTVARPPLREAIPLHSTKPDPVEIRQVDKLLPCWKKIPHLAIQRDGQLDQRWYGHRPLSVLDHSNMSTIQRDAVCKLVLADPFGLPYFTDLRPN